MVRNNFFHESSEVSDMDEKSAKNGWKEKRNAFYVILIFILVISLSGVIVVLKLRKIYGDNICLSADCVNSSEFFLDIINNSVNPCDNFYEFACGGYESSISTLEKSQKKVLKEYSFFILDPIQENDSDAIKTQKKYFNTCMNTSVIEADDNASIKKIFEQLGGWPIMSPESVISFNFEKITEQCVDLGLFYDWFIAMDVDQRSARDSKQVLRITAPNKANFVQNKYKENYQLLIENIVKRFGSKRTLDDISEAAKNIVEFETSLSKIISETGTYIDNRTIADLKTTYPSLPWKALLKSVVIEKGSNVEVSWLYFSKLIRLLDQTSVSVKTNYIFWKITTSLNPFLARDIRREFESYEDVISNKIKQPQERLHFCYDITQQIFAYVSEAAYAKKYSSERESIKEIVENIKIVLHDHINVSKWMNHTHKTYALDKLRNIKAFIGAPDEVFDEREFDRTLGVDEIDILNLNNTLDIVREVDKNRDKYNFNVTRTKISYHQADLYRGIVNIEAKYLPEDNIIYIPAAIIGGVYDSHKGLNFRNYSVLGTIIAHEIVHGFGIIDFIQMNQINSPTWLNQDFDMFLQETKCILEQCSEFDSSGQLNETCNKTFDENFADYASIDVSYEAFKKMKKEEINQLPGLKYTLNQLFWISYAGTMCKSSNSTLLNAHKNDSTLLNSRHLESAHRILGSYRNSKYFAKDFNCTLGTYMNPIDKCSVL